MLPASCPPYRPHRLVRHPAAMTAAGALLPRRVAVSAGSGVERVHAVDARNGVRARHHAGPPGAPALVLVHGLVGSAASPYVRGTAAKALARGFHVARLDVRGCGGTEELAADAYHGGLTADVLAVARYLAAEGRRVALVGFSIGGNMVLKLAGELGPEAPEWLAAVVAVSPCLDLGASADALERGAFERLCRRRFLSELRAHVRRRAVLHPCAVDLEGMGALRTFRAFDDRVTAPLGGFRGVDDYYARASALPLLGRLSVPALALAARDDPLVPFATLERPEVAASPLRVVATDAGGHVAFVAAGRGRDPDRFWAECRAVDAAAAACGLGEVRTPGPVRGHDSAASR